MLLINSSSTNIALLFLYAISLRFILFFYWKPCWEVLEKRVEEITIASSKKSKKRWSGLIVVTLNNSQSPFWKGIYGVIHKLNICPFCQGCWAGYLVYLLLAIDFSNLTLNIQQVVEFAFFSWSCGIVSRLTTPKIDSL
jgi:RNA polymerase subunit RPABC4/transcription elongation factor Spt4